MHRNWNILMFLLLLLWAGCNSNKIYVKFTDPQPQNIKNKYEFDKDIIGNYSYKNDGNILISLEESLDINEDTDFRYDSLINTIIINDISIINKISGRLTIDSASINENDFSLDTLILLIFKRPNYSYIFDSSLFTIELLLEDTLFYISETNILRQYKGKYYINITDTIGGKWDVYQMFLEKDNLWINSISQEDAALIKRLTAIKLDYKKSKPLINPPKSVFKKFLKMRGFEKKKKLDKI